jgi:hypothetical protein
MGGITAIPEKKLFGIELLCPCKVKRGERGVRLGGW